MYLPQALMTLFALWVPLSSLVRCLTLFETEGLSAMLAMTVALLDCVQARLLQARDVGDLLGTIKDMKKFAPSHVHLYAAVLALLPDARATEADNLWIYQPDSGARAIAIRREPFIEGPRTAYTILSGQTFSVSEVREGADGIRYLKLADGRGWVFDKKPGAGQMCSKLIDAKPRAQCAASPVSMNRDGSRLVGLEQGAFESVGGMISDAANQMLNWAEKETASAGSALLRWALEPVPAARGPRFAQAAGRSDRDDAHETRYASYL